LRHLGAAISQDRNRFFNIPIVNDPFHDVSVAAARDGLKEVAGDCFAAIGNSSSLEF